MKEINKRKEGKKRMVLVRMRDKEGKREVMRKKGGLKEKEERIEDDWTWKERTMQWRLEEIARDERRRNRRVMVRCARMWIEGKWWQWNEERERLVDEKGGKRGREEIGRGEEGEKEERWDSRGRGQRGGRGERGEGNRRERGKEREMNMGKTQGNIKVAFWNVAGVKGKEQDFWERMKNGTW